MNLIITTYFNELKSQNNTSDQKTASILASVKQDLGALFESFGNAEKEIFKSIALLPDIIPNNTLIKDSQEIRSIIGETIIQCNQLLPKKLDLHITVTPTFYSGYIQELDGVMGLKDEKQAQIYTRITEGEDFQAIKVGKDLEETRQKITEQATEFQQKRVPLRSPKEQEKIYSISLNHEKDAQAVEVLRFLIEEKVNISKEVEESINVKRAQENTIWNKLDSEIETVNTADNKELMDIVYPPKEQIDILNQEIVKNTLFSVWSFIINPVDAFSNRLSNEDGHLFVYPYGNLNLVMEVPGNNNANGQIIKLHHRNGSYAQDFYFDDETGQIKSFRNGNKCLDVNNSEYVDGQAVHLWDCHGGMNQKWEAWPNGEIRSQGARWMCLDASGGVVAESQMKIYHCNGGTNQSLIIGDGDFSLLNTGRYMRMHASATIAPIDGLTGHALISVGKRNLNGKQCWTTNTFSFWPGDDWNNDNTVGRTNNIRTTNNLRVDKDSDWDVAITNAITYRHRDLNISKRRYDTTKYMNGYYGGMKDYWNNTVPGYNGVWRNCASLTRNLWYMTTNEWHSFTNPVVDTPGSLYNSIWWFNQDEGPNSQCTTNTFN